MYKNKDPIIFELNSNIASWNSIYSIYSAGEDLKHTGILSAYAIQIFTKFTKETPAGYYNTSRFYISNISDTYGLPIGIQSISRESLSVASLDSSTELGLSPNRVHTIVCTFNVGNCTLSDTRALGFIGKSNNIQITPLSINTPINACDPVLGNLSPIPCYGTEEYMVNRYNGDIKTNLWHKKMLVSKPNGHIATQLSDDRTIAMVRLGYGGDGDQFAIDIDSGRTADLRIFPSQLVLFMK